MPQMSPLLWLILFIMFSSLFLLSSFKIFFSSPHHKPLKDQNYKLMKTNEMFNFNWKW